jgi:ankyrin repeat protein
MHTRWKDPLNYTYVSIQVMIIIERMRHIQVSEVSDTQTSVQLKDSVGRTALHWAAMEGHDEVVDVNIDKRS